MEISNARYISLILSLLLSISFPDTFAQKTDTSKFYNDSLNALSLKHVTIVSDANIRRNNTYQFSVNEIKSLVSVVGEPDVLRYLGTLPGISQGMEGGLGYFVRGSNSGNNRVELDGVPVYGNTHLFGLFSIFPSEIVESVNFMSGKIPASSGNLLASVTQISTLSLDTGKIVGGLSLSPFIAGANIKGKLTDKIGFQVAGRYSLLSPVFRLLKSSFDMDGEVLPEVTDLYAKVHYRPIENHEIDISGYYSNDYLKYSGNADDNYNKIAINWGNKIFRLSWNYRLSSRYSLKALAYYNDFYSGQEQQNYTDEKLRSELRLQSRLKELSASVSLKYQKDNLGWELGYHANSRNIRPASEKMYIINNKTDELKYYTYNPDTHSSINAVYGELKYLYKLLEMNFGYRGNYYQSKNYSRWDNNIRASLTVTLPGASGIEISYDEFSQFHHIAEGLPAGWDLDLIMPSDNVFVPEKARQYYTGTYWAKGKYHFSAGVYCKSMDNLISYKNGANVFGVQNTNWQEEITSGSGTSRGLEVRAERKSDDWTAALSYTLSKTDRHFKEINGGEKFPFKFDRRHILNINGQILTRNRSGRKQYLNLSMSYSSGHRLTIPVERYLGIEPPFWSQQTGNYIPQKEQDNADSRQRMSNVNGYVLPYYMRWDIGYSFFRQGKRSSSEFNIGVFNLFNRKNPYLIFYDEDRWKQLSIFPLIPSLRWTINF